MPRGQKYQYVVVWNMTIKKWKQIPKAWKYILFVTILHFYLIVSLGNFWLYLMYEKW